MEKTLTISYSEYEGLLKQIETLKEDLKKHPCIYLGGRSISYNEAYAKQVINEAKASVFYNLREEIRREEEGKAREIYKDLEKKVVTLSSHLEQQKKRHSDYKKNYADNTVLINNIVERVTDYNEQGPLHRLFNKLFIPGLPQKLPENL